MELRGTNRPSRIARNANRAGLGPSVVSGVRFALEPGRGRTAVPVRTAMIGNDYAGSRASTAGRREAAEVIA